MVISRPASNPEAHTPLHHLETVYRRLCEHLTTADTSGGALRAVVDSWLFTLHEDVLAAGTVDPTDAEAVLAATDTLAEQRLGTVADRAPALAAVLRGYRRALSESDEARAEGLLAWLGGQPHVAASIKRSAFTRHARKALTAFADNSRHASPWAAALYADARRRGKRHPHAIRILARAWMRVIWACWQNDTPYDPSQHGGERRLAA